ncbi:MAG: cytochrome c oxidase subunit 2 [Rhodothermaceae bacterium]|nr:MAG: cytochrome c oxidase subunit 2 [Rhodothermaceae bacterium]
MGENGTVWLPDPASTLAPELDSLFYFVYYVSLLIFLGVILSMAYFTFVYRRRQADEMPAFTKDNKIVEMASVVIPTILVLVVFTWGFQLYVKLYTAPPDAYEIQARARQWSWEFEYPNGSRSFGELHVPADRPVRVVMNSQDVIHSFFIPAFRVKMDVLPNRYTSVWFQATKEGEYDLFCTEYCGTAHSGMIGKVIVHNEAGFRQWLQESQTGDMTPVERGQLLYTQQTCNACHSVDGTPGVGPTFKGLFGRQRPLEGGGTVLADEDYIRESIVNPMAKVAQGFNPVMPPSYGSLPAEDLDALVAYIKSLGEGGN